MTDEPVLDGLNLVVGDMDATLRFYRTLGVPIPDEMVWGTESGAHHVDLRLGNGLGLDFDSAALAQAYNAGWDASPGPRTLIGFKVSTREAVDETYARLTAAGYTGLQEPYDAFWGARYAIVEDPDGRQVGMMSPPDPARRAAPPPL